MVNFDLPWNPLRIEQRIGRIHRIGQQEDVRIYNLSAAGTIEAEVLSLLDAKINLFELVVGELDMILGRLTKAADFEDIVMDTVMSALDGNDLKQRMDALGEELREAKKHYDQVKHLDENLFERLVADDE
jgi:SNF2 family DNA or RNA helicase